MTNVYFASNRVYDDATSPESYTKDISQDLVYGTAEVENVEISEDQAGFIKRICDVNVGSFPKSTQQEITGAGQNLLVFIHGFDNSFQDAITRAAFNREWLAASRMMGANTSVLAFSWPSIGRRFRFPTVEEVFHLGRDEEGLLGLVDRAYKCDQAMACQSGSHLIRFFDTLEPILARARDDGRRTLLLAHSMGNFALQSSVAKKFMCGEVGNRLFDLAVLAAADCDWDTFHNCFDFDPSYRHRPFPGLSGLPLLAGRVLIYYSKKDFVLKFSRFINTKKRLGEEGSEKRDDTTAFPPDRFSMVDASGFDDYERNLLSSHQYYRLSPAARRSIIDNIDRIMEAELPA